MNPEPYYGPYRVMETGFSLGPGVAAAVASENFHRVAILFGVGGTNTINISTKSSVTSASGMAIQGGSPGPVGFTFQDFGPLIGQAWFATASAPITCTVIEIIRDRDVGEKWQLIPELQSAESEPSDVYDPIGQLG